MPESLHRIGCIQLSSALVIFDVNSENVVGVSENIGSFIAGQNAEDAIGKSVREVLGRKSVHDLRNSITLDSLGKKPEILGSWDLGCGVVDATTYRHDNQILVELQPSKTEVSSLVLVKDIARLNERIVSSTTLAEMLNAVARPLRILSGYDRLQVVKVGRDNQGEVIAEARRAVLEPTIGANLDHLFDTFPARPAPFQFVLDAKSKPVDVLSNANQTVEIGLARFNAPLSARTERLRALDMQAEILQPIVLNGKTWGAMVYQNRRPRVPSLRFQFVASSTIDLVSATIFGLIAI